MAAGSRLDVVGTASSWSFEIEPDAAITPTGPANVVLTLATTRAQLRSLVDALAQRIRPAGALWIAWPREAAGHISEATENLIREVVLPLGLVDVKVAAIDSDWSGLKVGWRKKQR
jgi:hypothetical protein